MHYIVYKTTNQVNGKFYIGTHKTVDLNDDYLGSGTFLKRAIEKYGVENFKREILFIFDNSEAMFAKEAEIVTEEFLAENNTYNLKRGGCGGFDFINSNPDILAKYSGEKRKQTGNWIKGLQKQKYLLLNDIEYQERYKRKVSEVVKKWHKEKGHPWVGRKHSDETKLKISQKNSTSQLGKKNSQFGTMWITNELSSKKVKVSDPIPIGWRKGRVWTGGRVVKSN